MSLLILIAAAVGLVWSGVFLRCAGLWGICLAVLLVGTVLGHAFFHVSLVTLDRLLLAVGAGVYVWDRRWGLAAPKRWSAVDSLLLALLAVLTYNTLAHDWQIKGMLPLSRLIFFFLLPTIMYWLARQTAISTRGLLGLFGCFAILGIYLSVTSVAERFGIGAAVFPRYIMDPSESEFLGRGRGPLLNPCGNGILITAGLCGLLTFFPRVGRVGKLALLGLTLVLLAGLYGTLTRSVWIGGGLALLLLFAVALPRQWRLPSLAAAMVAAGIIAGASWEQAQAFKRDKHVSVEDMRDSASLRPLLAAVAWQMFQDQPLLGVGYGQYRVHAVNYLGDRTVDLPLEKARPYLQHNVFLSLLTETGLIGAGLFVLLLVCWSENAWRLWRCQRLPLEARQTGLLFLGTLIAYGFNGLFHEVSIIPMINMYLFFLAGTVRNLAAVAAAEAPRVGCG